MKILITIIIMLSAQFAFAKAYDLRDTALLRALYLQETGIIIVPFEYSCREIDMPIGVNPADGVVLCFKKILPEKFYQIYCEKLEPGSVFDKYVQGVLFCGKGA